MYAHWIVTSITAALRRHHLADVPVRAPAITPPGTRRRVRLAYSRRGAGVSLGFRALASHRIVDLAECPVATAAITRALPPLRELLASFDGGHGEGEVVITELIGGLDVVLIRRDPPSLAERERVAAFAERADIARLSLAPDPHTDPEPLMHRRAVAARFAEVDVTPPPGAFLQASVAAEAWIRQAVDEAVGETRDLLDLFSGCGTFGLPQAARGTRLHAVDSGRALLAALDDAARRIGPAGRVTTERRDLERRPLQPDELRGFDAAIVDPPRAGAAAQARALAAAAVPRIAMVSCNPRTFARDARILVDGGYRPLWVQPVDPFLWSAELEVVGAFERGASPNSHAGRLTGFRQM